MDSTGYPWMYGGLLRTETSAYDPIATHQTLLISSDTGEIFVAFVMMFMSPTVTATPLSVGLLIKFWTQGRGFSSRYRAASFRACPLSVRFILWSRFMSKKKFKPFRYLHQLTWAQWLSPSQLEHALQSSDIVKRRYSEHWYGKAPRMNCKPTRMNSFARGTQWVHRRWATIARKLRSCTCTARYWKCTHW